MRLIDLTHSVSRKSRTGNIPPVAVRSADAIHLVPLDRLVTLATVIDLTSRVRSEEISREDLSRFGLAGIAGCILRTGWLDKVLVGCEEYAPPQISVGAAAYLLEAGVRTVAADFPITGVAADLLLHNNSVLVQCVSGLSGLNREVVRLIALPIKFDDAVSAEARVIAMED
ncbi:MAG: cyclase family protein [Armatimonadetes bacterium]|nr:cyclase family protein [Armatimonadota bacterium]